jgi:hypothetical protein
VIWAFGHDNSFKSEAEREAREMKWLPLAIITALTAGLLLVVWELLSLDTVQTAHVQPEPAPPPAGSVPRAAAAVGKVMMAIGSCSTGKLQQKGPARVAEVGG